MHEFDLIVEKVEESIKEGLVDEELQELWAVPIRLKPIVKLDDSTFYGSDKLNEKFIISLGKQDRTKGIIKKLESMVKKKKVNPCFFTKGFIGFIAWRIFAPLSTKSIMGFYDPNNTKRIYILLNNSANIFTYASDSAMAKLTIHELVHMISHETTKFMSLFKKEMISYYKAYFKRMFSLNNKFSDKDAEKVLIFIYKTFEKGGKTGNSELVKYFKFLEKTLKPFTTIDNDLFIKQLTDLIIIAKLYFKNINAFFANLRKFKHILQPLYHAYNDAFGMKNLSTLCIQELFYPSEIISIYSEKSSLSKIYTGIKAL